MSIFQLIRDISNHTKQWYWSSPVDRQCLERCFCRGIESPFILHNFCIQHTTFSPSKYMTLSFDSTLWIERIWEHNGSIDAQIDDIMLVADSFFLGARQVNPLLLVLGVQTIAGDAFDSYNMRKTKLTMLLIYSFFRDSRHYSEKHSHRMESAVKTVRRRESSNESV